MSAQACYSTPGLDASDVVLEIRDAILGHEPFVALTGTDGCVTQAVVDAVIDALPKSQVRFVRISNPSTDVWTLGRLLIALRGDGNGEEFDEAVRAMRLLRHRVGDESQVVLVVEQAELLTPPCIRLLRLLVRPADVSLLRAQILFVGRPSFWMMLEDDRHAVLRGLLATRVAMTDEVRAAAPVKRQEVRSAPAVAAAIVSSRYAKGNVLLPLGLAAALGLAALVVAQSYRSMSPGEAALMAGPVVLTQPRQADNAAPAVVATAPASRPAPVTSLSMARQARATLSVPQSSPALATAAPPQDLSAARRSETALAVEPAPGQPLAVMSSSSPPSAAAAAPASAEGAPTGTAPMLDRPGSAGDQATGAAVQRAGWWAHRVVIHFKSTSVAAHGAADRISAQLRGEATAAEMRAVGDVPRNASVRYYADEDRQPAQSLATALGAEALFSVQDFTAYRPRPPAGTLEVWLPSS